MAKSRGEGRLVGRASEGHPRRRTWLPRLAAPRRGAQRSARCWCRCPLRVATCRGRRAYAQSTGCNLTAGRPPGRPRRPSAKQVGGALARRPLSPRARERLRIAAALLRADRVVIDDARGFYEGVLAAIAVLAPDVAGRLRSNVDWVESYCGAETRFLRADASASVDSRCSRDPSC